MDIAAYKRLVAKFLNNECDYAEAERAFLYLQENTDALDEIVFTEDLDETDFYKNTFFRKKQILNKVLDIKSPVVKIGKFLAAACLIGLIVFGFFLYKPEKKEIQRNSVSVNSEMRVRNNMLRQMTYDLPDSSTAILLPEAEVIFKNNFKDVRNILVESGDVFFKVHKNKQKPFRVIANGIETEAVGTQFWVRNFETINSLSIALTEGKIKISSRDRNFTMNEVVLKPGQVCSINKSTGKVDISGNNVHKNNPVKTIISLGEVNPSINANEITWTNNDMQFSNAMMENVFEKLEKRYNVKIVADDPNVMKSYLTGKIFYSDSLDMIIKSICQLNKLTYERKNDSIILKRK